MKLNLIPQPRQTKIFFVTADDLKALGAPSTTDPQIVKSLTKLGYKVLWFGINVSTREEICHEAKDILVPRSFFKRCLLKIYRILRFQTLEDQKLEFLKKFDEKLLDVLDLYKDDIDEDTVFIGRSVSSLRCFNFVKSLGGRCILHSQWMHPNKQNSILSDAFAQMDLKEKAIPIERIEIQLKEIELSDHIWCISKLVYDSYIENNVSPKKLIHSSLGVDSEIYFPKRSKKKDYKKHIVFVGNINFEKGVHILLDSLSSDKFKDCKLSLIGAVAPYFKRHLDSYVDRLSGIGISINIKAEFPLKHYHKADLFVLPSLHESFGLVVLEAMSCGLPVIITDQVGASELIQSNQCGYIIPSNDTEALRESILSLINNKDLRNLYGVSSREVAKNLSWDNVTKNLTSKLNLA